MTELMEKDWRTHAPAETPSLTFVDVHQMPQTRQEADFGSGMSKVRKDFESVVANQGFIGQTFDYMKDHLGASVSSNSSTLKKAWSSVLNYDDSSEAIRYKLSRMDDAATAMRSLHEYDRSQRDGVDTLTYVAALASGLKRQEQFRLF